MSETPAVPVHMRRVGFSPTEELGRLRTEAPVTKIEVTPGSTPIPVWLVTRYDDVREILGDHSRFSNVPQPPKGSADEKLVASLSPGLLNLCDPPEHTRLRKMLTPEFNAKRLRRLQPLVETIVAERLDAMDKSDPPVDLVAEFAEPIPSRVICELLGVSYEDGETILRQGAMSADRHQTPEEREAEMAAARDRMNQVIERQRREPGEGVLGVLVREHGDELSDAELIGLSSLLMLAGYDNTASMLSLGTLLLFEHPDQLAKLRAEPDLLPGAVEEMLRFLSVAHAPSLRRAVQDLTLGGQQIKAGDMMLCSFAAANRDETLGDGLDHFDLTRKPVPHFAFGHGIHFCVAAPLAKIVMKVALPALFDRFPTLRAAVPFEAVHFRTMTPGFGLESLPVTW
jgi:cytochrome P450